VVNRTVPVLLAGAWLGAQAIGVAQSTATQSGRTPQFENDSVKVWKSVIVPNGPLTLHRHEHGRTIIALVGGDLKVVKESGATSVMHWETGKAYWLPPDPPGEMHKDVNDTGRTIEVMVVEMKD
jgi:beta-alanine degradation protein BauB